MKQIILTFGLILCGSVLFGQSPRIRLNQITKDSLTGSVVLSGSDSNMVYSRNFFLNLTDSVLILFGDTLSTTATAFTGVTTNLTLTGNGTVGNELKVDTAIIATVSALADSLAGIISSVTTDLTLTGDGSIATPLKVDTSVIATIRALSDSVATRGTVSSVAVSAGTGISVSGSPITTSGTITITNSAPDQTVALTGGTGITTSGTYPNFTINNSAPDQTVSITGAGINAVTGTYPNFTITGTEVDGSTTNELQTISTTGAAGNITLSNGGGTLNLNVNDADASATNEGSLSVGAGGANSSDIVSNTSGSTAVTIAGGSNVTVTESGSTITIASTAGGTGTVTSITAGTYLSGGTITTSGTIALDTASAGLKTYIGANIGTVDLASEVTGTLPVSNGGTGATTLTANKILVGNGTSAVLQPTNLHWDNTNSRLGIKSNTPTYVIEAKDSTVAGGGSYFGIMNLNTEGAGGFIIAGSQGFSSDEYFTFQLLNSQVGTYLGNTSLNNLARFRSGPDLNGIRFATAGNKPITFFPNDTEAARFTGDGEVLIGYTTDQGSYKLQVNSQIFATNATIATSDIKFKTNINDLDSSLNLLMELKPKIYDFKLDPVHNFPIETQVGFIAQDVESVLSAKPYLGSIIYQNNGYKGMAYEKLIPITVKAIQEQQVIIESQKAEIEQLKTQYNDLLQRIINLENK